MHRTCHTPVTFTSFLFLIIILNVSEAYSPKHYIKIKGVIYQCAIGREGFTYHKKEGDGKTPHGKFHITQIYYRKDRIDLTHVKTNIPLVPITQHSGWCDDVHSRAYNKYVPLPCNVHHEKLWRSDHLYDIIVVLDYNMNPIEIGKGSAIFMHIAGKNYLTTEGCIALSQADLLTVISGLMKGDVISI